MRAQDVVKPHVDAATHAAQLLSRLLEEEEEQEEVLGGGVDTRKCEREDAAWGGACRARC
eukprot:CAMPEP_0181320042 /NCGR_PEP_ID=MMETSP1101-20121128/17904_1 /TAXON_ID=46948 /ORGANISM="Rhodomonas abbreviata, Strain Caron Lab Isolate" /LENGTH=59 /DNA_ID=CAMNT_0023427703 /DNA_START=264 /DNA_END=443 /DNA_ORIENTATION=+